MIKTGIKNYFKNLKHFFTPIGTLAVGMFIGLSIFLPCTISTLSALVEKLTEIVKDASIDFGPVKDSVADAVRALDWDDPIAALRIVFSRDWLGGVLHASLDTVSNGLQPYGEAISNAVNSAVEGIKWFAGLFILFCVLGLIAGYFLTRFLVRRNMAKRTFKKYLLATFIDSFVTSALIAVSFGLLTLWAPSIFITSVLSLVIFACTSLISAYLVHGKNKVDFKTVINYKNVLKLLLTNAIIFVIAFAFLLITVAITNVIAGILIGFSFVEIAFIVMSLNAENYVLNLADTVVLAAEEDIAEIDESEEEQDSVEVEENQ